MSLTFNADEIFEMAEDIERNAGIFYRENAEKSKDKKIKQLFLKFAKMEDSHLVIFQNMRTKLSELEKAETAYDPDSEAVLYLKAMADSHGYEGLIGPNKKLTGKETPKKIIEIALNSEKESVLFYFGLKEFVPVNAGREKVEAVILEEINHITTLLNYLKEMS